MTIRDEATERGSLRAWARERAVYADEAPPADAQGRDASIPIRVIATG
jgi:hypothetical protein